MSHVMYTWSSKGLWPSVLVLLLVLKFKLSFKTLYLVRIHIGAG